MTLYLDGQQIPVDIGTLPPDSSYVVIDCVSPGVTEQFNIQLPMNVAPGVYDASILSSSHIAFFYFTNTDFYSAQSPGKAYIVVTRNNTTHHMVEGTFHGTLSSLHGSDPHVVNGSFLVNY